MHYFRGSVGIFRLACCAGLHLALAAPVAAGDERWAVEFRGRVEFFQEPLSDLRLVAELQTPFTDAFASAMAQGLVGNPGLSFFDGRMCGDFEGNWCGAAFSSTAVGADRSYRRFGTDSGLPFPSNGTQVFGASRSLKWCGRCDSSIDVRWRHDQSDPAFDSSLEMMGRVKDLFLHPGLFAHRLSLYMMEHGAAEVQMLRGPLMADQDVVQSLEIVQVGDWNDADYLVLWTEPSAKVWKALFAARSDGEQAQTIVFVFEFRPILAAPYSMPQDTPDLLTAFWDVHGVRGAVFQDFTDSVSWPAEMNLVVPQSSLWNEGIRAWRRTRGSFLSNLGVGIVVATAFLYLHTKWLGVR